MTIYLKNLLSIVIVFGFCSYASANEDLNIIANNLIDGESTTVAKAKSTKSKKRRRTYRASRGELKKAIQLVKQKQYQPAAKLLFRLSFSPRHRSDRAQIKYILGLVLHELKMYQGAAFQFISVLKMGQSKYVRQSIEKLSLAADKLEDDTLLNYAISKVKLRQFPKSYRDLLYFRIGEFQMRSNDFSGAVKSFSRVKRGSDLYGKALYLSGLSNLELKNTQKAISYFDKLTIYRDRFGITDPERVAGLMGKARAFYQAKNWDKAIEIYRDIPRDTEAWHDTLFENSWAMLRSGRFRSALSNFQSLHSTFYEGHYLPESLLVRSIVYLYICKYDEMEKVLGLFNRIYKPVYKEVNQFLKSSKRKDPVGLFNEAIKVILQTKKKEEVKAEDYSLPYVILRHLIRNGDFQRSYRYIKNLLEEKRVLEAMPADWQNSAVGKYEKRVVQRRLLKARAKSGRILLSELQGVKDELFELFEQEAFIKYEMLNGKKEFLKKKVAGKSLPVATIDEDNSRDYYIQNGYEYWRFKGEYWLDELGNYHYVGTQSCE